MAWGHWGQTLQSLGCGQPPAGTQSDFRRAKGNAPTTAHPRRKAQPLNAEHYRSPATERPDPNVNQEYGELAGLYHHSSPSAF